MTPPLSTVSTKSSGHLKQAVEATFWNVIVGGIFFLFFLYIISQNELQTWVNILFYNPSEPLTVKTDQGTGMSDIGALPPGLGGVPPSKEKQNPSGSTDLPGGIKFPDFGDLLKGFLK